MEIQINKVLWVVAVLLLLIIGGFFLAAFFISRVEEKPLREVLRDVSPFGDIVGDSGREVLAPVKDGGLRGVAPSDIATKDGVIPKLYKISAEPISGAAAFMRNGTEYVRFVLIETGHIYEYGATTTKTTRLSNTTAPAIKEVLWDTNGDSLVIRYLDENDVIKTYAGAIFYPKKEAAPGEASGEFFGAFLEDNIRELAVSPSGEKFFYLAGSDGSMAGIVSDFQNKKKERSPGFPFSEWLAAWPKNDTLVLTTKPSLHAEGFSYSYVLATGVFKRLVGGVFGLTVLPSPSLESILYSQSAGGGIETFIKDVKAAAASRFFVSTLPEKCAWGKEPSQTVYCGVPLDIPRGEYPDDWYQGKISFSDALWRIDTENNAVLQLSMPETDVGEAIDVTHPFLSKNDGFLFFINKKDSSLWSLKLGS